MYSMSYSIKHVFNVLQYQTCIQCLTVSNMYSMYQTCIQCLTVSNMYSMYQTCIQCLTVLCNTRVALTAKVINSIPC